MSTRLRSLSRVKRVVIKIGSALLVDRGSGIRKDWLDAISDDIAALKSRGTDVLVVSSGATACARARFCSLSAIPRSAAAISTPAPP